MAKLILTVAALFVLFAFSHARTPSDLLPNEIKGRDAADKVPVADAQHTNTLLLPSERPESESATVAAEWEPETAAIESNEENTVDSSKPTEVVPLTVISFRPVGRQFPRRPFPFSFRQRHRCGGHRQGKRLTPRFHGSELERDTPYGDDMILSSGNEMRSDHPAFRGGVRQIPARWVNFRHGGPRFPFKHDDDMESERPHRHHRHHDHDHYEVNEGEEKPREHNHDHEHRHEHEHKHRGGLMKSFRKFLNGF
jgi:hypothetical protein